MSNKLQYDNIFIEMLSIDKGQLQGLEYNSIPQWDSVGHMTLMAALEETFSIMMDMEEIIDFSSYDRGIEILNKHNVVI
jgi:acyl carrier protein